MYCTFCGKRIADDSAFCVHCGKPVPQGSALAKLVAAARAGDQDAISALYEKTYSKVFYTVKSMIKDEDAVFDIVQDTYLKAFAHLDAFEGDAKFLPWVRQIAANTARDWLKKKRPMLFTEIASDDGQDTPVEELLPDARSENLPDRVIDQKETKRLIREIIEDLPEDQRAAIGMFYYEQMSVKQIAAAMGASESAVKSRLMYARGKIEKKVRELEKKGTKFYNLAPLPFLLLLFRSLKAGAAEAPNAQILQAVLASDPVGVAIAAGAASGAAQGAAGAGAAGTAAGTGAAGGTGAGAAGTAAGTGAAGGTGAGAAGTAAGTGATGTVAAGAAASAGTAGTAAAGGAAAAAGGFAALKLGIAALAAAAVIGLGVFGAVQIVSSLSDAPSEPPAREDVFDRDESERPKRHEEAETPEEPDPIDEALEQYRTIIGQAESYEYGEGLVSTGYQYALVQMRPDDPVPTLLLKMDTEDFISYVRFFQYDPDTKSVHQPAETVIEGVAGVGGYRGSLAMAGDGVGMFSTEWSSGTGAAWISRITLDGDTLIDDDYWTGNILEVPDSITYIAIDWHEIEDLSALDGYVRPETPEDSETPEELAPIDAAREQYRTIIQHRDSDFGDMTPTGYRYALVQMQPEDPVPTLLLEVEVFDTVCYFFSYQYDPDTKTVYYMNECAILDTGITEGPPQSLSMAGDGEGMLFTEWYSGTSTVRITRITLNGDHISQEVLWTGLFDGIPESFTGIPIEWHEITDISLLDGSVQPET